MGNTARVYAIPHGCVRLTIPHDDTKLPTVVVRQHDGRGRVVTRRFPVPDTNLNRATGSIGTCGDAGAYLFFVRYPFVTIVASQLYDVGAGRPRECTDLGDALLWTGQLSRLPSLSMTWYTHRGTS